MAYYLTSVDHVKRALRIDTSDDDTLLDMYVQAASQAVIVYLNEQATEILGDLTTLEDSPSDVTVPADIEQATAMLVGHWYRQPDGDTDKEFEDGGMPRVVKALLWQRRDPALA